MLRFSFLGVATGFVAFLVSAFVVRPAAAEAGVPFCFELRIVEVFPGAAGCEDADYVVVEAESISASGFGDWELELGDACELDWIWLSGEESLLAADGGGTLTLLIGTRNVIDVFGITPDVLLDETSPLSLAGGSVGT